VNNVVGFSVYGDYRTNSPPSAIIAAVARGDVDVAAAWGPMAGYFASLEREPLDITPVPPSPDGPSLPQTFSISMATRRREPARLARLNQFIDSHRHEIDRLLDDFHVPRVAAEASPAGEH
jgi:mxaJ protein